MLTQQDCLNALANGKTLTNGQAYVHLNKAGNQVLSGYIPKKTRQHYSFDSPEYWHVYIPKKTKNLTTIMYFIIVFATMLNLGVYFYETPTASIPQYRTKYVELQKAYNQLSLEHTSAKQQLEVYQITETQLKDLGASTSQAREIIKAAEVYNINPKF